MDASETRAEITKMARHPSAVEAMKPPKIEVSPAPPQDPIAHIEMARWRSRPSK